MEREKIGVDVDQVCFNVVTPFLDFHNGIHGTSFTIGDVHSYNLAEVLGVSAESLGEEFDVFDAENLMGLPVIEGAREALEELAREHEIYAVTSRPLTTRDVTIASLSATFPGCFSAAYFTGQSFDLIDRHSETKGSLCKKFGLRGMVEDSLEHAREIRITSPGTPVYLFGRYRWNETNGELPGGVVRTYTWEDVVREVDARRSST